MNGRRRRFLALLRDPGVQTIVVEHRDRCARFGAEYFEAALAAQGRQLVVVDPSEANDNLVRDVTEILTSLCARLFERHAAANRVASAMVTGAQGRVQPLVGHAAMNRGTRHRTGGYYRPIGQPVAVSRGPTHLLTDWRRYPH
jgi:hypothetical protein